MDNTTLTEQTAAEASQALKGLSAAVNEILFGQETLIETVILALLAGGHLLLEGLPGLGKTELVRTFSKTLDLDTKRVQFTPDLLPGDITGNPMLQEKDGQRTFVFQEGPVFTNLLLADEINRASPKTQSALLEAMQERRVTVMGTTYALPFPFFVFATQNPIELEGTYPLPEAQLDRFLFKLNVYSASKETLEKIITARTLGQEPVVRKSMTGEQLARISQLTNKVFLPEIVKSYIARLVHATYPNESTAAKVIKFGASPRAAIGLASAARARALLEGRIHASVDDVRMAAPHVLGHRIIINYQDRMEGVTPESFIAKLIAEINPEEAELPKSLSAAKIK
ncbi:AAA family ATPase [Cerasicoccus maritimus]|uniref:AAA family ATPase n=1 Tax=Cerasicoccus maritimus TaxID=490089 RepID=UPI00285293D8|nr:AAA family ATPase [Cerasicoccus maritimus]